MRIICGKYRSRVLAEFPGTDVRPTADRVKESLFNILSSKLYGARVLDLFCGSGALGLESLSRGAAEAIFNDNSKESIKLLQKNLKTLGAGKEAKVYSLDYASCLETMRGEFDVIFLDPPYRLDFGLPALKKIAERGLLRADGVAVYERDKPFADDIAGLEKFDERKYGKTYLSFFRKADAEKTAETKNGEGV